LGVIGSCLVLCQWFVFQSIRRYLLEKRKTIRRRVAYPVLLAFGLASIVVVRLEFGSELFPPGSFSRQLASVILFSYMGCALVLSSFFLLVRVLDASTQFKKSLLQRAPHDARSDLGRPSQIDYQHPTRRRFLKVAAASGLVAVAGLGAKGLAEAYSRPVVKRYDLFFGSLTGAPRPITLIHVTDCHFGMFCGRRELRNVVTHLNSLEGEGLCMTGDIFHSARTVVEQAIPILRKLKARLLGNFAVLGNHDFYAGEVRSVDALTAAGLTLLRDEWVTFRVGNSTIRVGGVDDPVVNWRRNRQSSIFGPVVGNSPAEPGVRILLSHRPEVFPEAAKQRIDVVLAGHTHGGQTVIPVPGREKGICVADFVSDYTNGWYRSDTSRMYVNAGVGLTFLPWRIHCPPEIAVIRLKLCSGNAEARS
jgi:uncharacterized protein